MKVETILASGHPDVDNIEEKIDAALKKVGRKGKIKHTNLAISGTSDDPWAMAAIW